MPLVRLTYFSENQIDPAAGSAVRILGQILSTSNRNNQKNSITGALLFDDQWFVQTLEGERPEVWATFDRIREDPRHSDVVIAEVVDLQSRIFANWWMGLATRTAATEHAFAPYLMRGRLDPRQMTASDMLSLMKALSQAGLHRELVEQQLA